MNAFIKFFLIVTSFYVSLSARDININKLVNSANKSGKHLFVWLHKTDCGYCENMREFTLDDDYVKPLVDEKFLFVHINISEQDKVVYNKFMGTGRDFAKHVGYDFYPTSLFFDSKAKLVYEAMGFHEEKIFLKILKYIDSKSYKEIDYETFENEYDFREGL